MIPLKRLKNQILTLQRDGLSHPYARSETSTQHKCLNCNNEFRGDYCPICGQAAATHRLTARDAVRNVFASIIAGDNIFFATCLNLIFRPGHMVRDYICGRRARYFRPVQMLVRLVAIYIIISFVFGQNIASVHIFSDDIMQEHVHSESLAKAIMMLTSLVNNKAILFLTLAFLSVMPFRLTFFNCKLTRYDGTALPLNTAEHFFVLIYVSCLNLLISCIAVPFYSMDGLNNFLQLSSFGLLLMLTVWMYRQLFGRGWLITLLRCLTAFMFTFMLTALLVIFAFGIFYGYDAVA